jgi:hypothetical protein
MLKVKKPSLTPYLGDNFRKFRTRQGKGRDSVASKARRMKVTRKEGKDHALSYSSACRKWNLAVFTRAV